MNISSGSIFFKGGLVMAKDDLKETRRLMGALLRMKPKPHEEMKVGKKLKKGSGKPNPRPSSRQKINK
jgi:hypothetical protein